MSQRKLAAKIGAALALFLVANCGSPANRVDAGPGAGGSNAGDAGTGAGGGGGTAAGGAGGGAGLACAPLPASDGGIDAGPDAGAAAACEACQRAHAEHDRCTPLLLTATYTEDPSSGDHIPVGWGLATLSTPAQREAGAALLRCLNEHRCATDEKNVCPGDNPTLGCFCGPGVTPEACISGAGVHGVCLSAYAAAAAATPGGPPAGATPGQVALFVTSKAYEPTGPIGLADMINRCAIAVPCEACFGL